MKLQATKTTLNSTFYFPFEHILAILEDDQSFITLESDGKFFILEVSGSKSDCHLKLNGFYVCRILDGKFLNTNLTLLNFLRDTICG